MLNLLTLRLHHCIFPCVNSAISITMPLKWYPLFQWHCNHNNCFSTTVVASIKLWILCCIYHQCTPCDVASIIISPPQSLFFHLFSHHCWSYNYVVSVSEFLCCIIAVTCISMFQCMYPFSSSVDCFLCVNLCGWELTVLRYHKIMLIYP